MTIYNVVLVTRDDSVSDPEIETIPCASRTSALNALKDAMNEEVRERGLLIKETDGILYMDGNDHFAFYNHKDGDWTYTGTVYERELLP